MIIGKRVVQIYSRDFGYQVRVPAPQSIESAIEHLKHIAPRALDNLEVVTLEVVEAVPAHDALRGAKRDTIPSPAPCADEAAE